MAENIIIDGLSCDNCPEFKRCQEQQTKKEYAINQVLQDIPSEYANIIDRLKQIIPSITRCDYVLEKQLSRKEQECEKLKTQILLLQTMEIKELKNYKQSLDEIEKYIKNQLDEFGNDVYNMDKSAINSIQSIINKAKEK